MSVATDAIAVQSTQVVAPQGDLNVHNAAQLYEQLDVLAGRGDVSAVVVDFSQVRAMDSSAVAVVALAKGLFESAGKRFDVRSLSAEHRQTFALMPMRSVATGKVEASEHPLEWAGQQVLASWAGMQRFLDLLTDTIFVVLGMFRRRMPPKGAITEQAVAIGVNALGIVALLTFLLGLIMAFQAAHQLRQFGANIFVANLVGISMVREFGPMMTAIIVAGRTGSAIAAELGTMQVQEEIDALRAMGLDPNRYLLLPRLVAITLMQPALTLMANAVGIFGGFLIGTMYLDLSAPAYINQTIEALSMGDVLNGLTKSVVFAWIIGLVGCYCGFNIEGGASGVGRATTRAVVTSIFLIIVADSIFTTASTVLKMG
ncbi:MAG: MlaE family lipid ABC transporter permease subunit [Bradymonadaceae bacterium]|nr:MlaE family lipid ABC transporter permease subunit [Lujinxingiaceae bacterium]